MKSAIDNNIIVIGADHHNTLAVIRSLGRMKCRQQLLIHTSHNTVAQVHVAQSRYAQGKIALVANTQEAIMDWLLCHITGEKQILFPCTDLAAYTIDVNYTRLCEHFILPGFKNAPGKVAKLMDKWEQSKFAEEHNLPMAKTWELTAEHGFCVPENMIYPCIVKPEISAFGRKADIVICDTADQLETALTSLKEAGYDALVVQQFLRKEYEVCAYGCLVDDRKKCAGGTIRKVREFPPRGGGSLTYAQFINVDAVNALRDHVLDILHSRGYRGQYDVELLVCKEGVYLNEINFRHSGNGYALVQNGVQAPYLWAVDAAGGEIPENAKTMVKTGKYHMDEMPDLINLRHHHVSYFSWIGDCLRTSAFSKWDIKDLKGTFAYYIPLLKATVSKRFK